MQGSARAALIVIVLCAAASLLGLRPRSDAAEAGITPATRAAALAFAGVEPQDRAWIQAAIAAARPEARRLIDEVDGLVTVRTDLNRSDTIYVGAPGGAIGLTQFSGSGATVALDLSRLNGERAIDRNMVVLHELGHVIDFVLVDDALMQQLDAGIPAGACRADLPNCTALEERFADTFAKWALRGRFSLRGSGYGVPTPPSLEDWGAPLGRLAIELDLRD